MAIGEIVWDEKPSNDIVWDEPKKSLTIPQELARQAGLGVRYVAEGAAALPGIFIDPWQKLGGDAQTFTGAVSNTLDRIGLPRPETGAEEVSGAISRAMVPAGALSKLVGMLPQAVLKAAPAIQSIASKPLAEILSSASGGGASEITKQAGGGPVAQAVAGAVTPMALSATGQVLGAVGRGINELRRPVTQKGAEQIAADVVGRLTQDKTTALENLNKYAAAKRLEQQTGQIVGVPGSTPTAGAVAADYGLIGGQQAIARGDAAPLFAQQYAKNNAARLADLAKLNATEQQIAAFVKKRDAITTPLREQAFAKAKGPVDYTPVAERIGSIATTAAGGRVESQKALNWLSARLLKYVDEGRADASNAYALHQDIGDLVAGKVRDENGAALRLAGGLANDIKKTLAQQIELAAPGFKKYMETYSRLSKPIDRLQVISDKLGGADLSRVTNAMPIATPEGAQFNLSQAKMRNQFGAIQSETNLAPRQRDILSRVMGDLNASELASRGGKQPGSDTYQNIASANLVNRVLGQTLGESGPARSAQKALGLLYRPLGLEARIQDMIVQAYQDPEKMRQLLAIARTSRESPTLAGLLDYTAPRVTGGLLGTFAQ